jgi:hypothetical protein
LPSASRPDLLSAQFKLNLTASDLGTP